MLGVDAHVAFADITPSLQISKYPAVGFNTQALSAPLAAGTHRTLGRITYQVRQSATMAAAGVTGIAGLYHLSQMSWNDLRPMAFWLNAALAVAVVGIVKIDDAKWEPMGDDAVHAHNLAVLVHAYKHGYLSAQEDGIKYVTIKGAVDEGGKIIATDPSHAPTDPIFAGLYTPFTMQLYAELPDSDFGKLPGGNTLYGRLLANANEDLPPKAREMLERFEPPYFTSIARNVIRIVSYLLAVAGAGRMLTLPETYEMGFIYFGENPQLLNAFILQMSFMGQDPIIEKMTHEIRQLNPNIARELALYYARMNRAIELFYAPIHESRSVLLPGFFERHIKLHHDLDDGYQARADGLQRIREAVAAAAQGVEVALTHLHMMAQLASSTHLPQDLVMDLFDSAEMDVRLSFQQDKEKGMNAVSVWAHMFHNLAFSDSTLTLGSSLPLLLRAA